VAALLTLTWLQTSLAIQPLPVNEKPGDAKIPL
jgi:hypothetical protein